MMKKHLFSLVFLVLLCIYISVSIAKGREDHFVSPEQAELLLQGLLQLATTLKDHAEKTNVQVKKAFERLQVYNQTLREQQTKENLIRIQKENLRIDIQANEVRHEMLHALTMELKCMLDNLIYYKELFSRRICILEKKLHTILEQKSFTENFSLLKSLVDNQSKRISRLLATVLEQEQQILQQDLKIEVLLQKVHCKVQAELNRRKST